MFSSRKTTGIVALATDPQFNYVTALLHGDGTNGAQNNTFLDLSSNAFSVTRNGTPTQGSFSPYGTLWSNYFDGASGYITAPLTFSYAGDFCVECWFNTTTTNTYACIYSDESSTAGATILINNASNNGQITVYMLPSVSNFASTVTGLNNGVWHHVAVTRSGSTLRLFVDGILQNTGTYSGTLATSSGTTRIGNSLFVSRFFGGYISNFRMVSGNAVYTSAFTPSTTPLTAISGTQLLTCQSNRFIDNSSNNYAITVYSTSIIQRFNPFLPTSSLAYSTSVYGGSGCFNGTTDYLNIASSSSFAYGSSNFTIEMWVYLTSISGYNNIYDQRTAPSGVVPAIYTSGSTLIYYVNGGALINASSALTANCWLHIAVCRSSTTTKMFVNGVQVGSVSDSNSYVSSPVYIGSYISNPTLTGYVSDVRILNGTALYTTTFTPPTSPLTAISNTQLLLNYQNAGIFDNAMMNDLITVGSAQVSTSVKKYGTGSLSFNGSTDYLKTFSSTVIQLNNNFTIECWVYFNSISSAQPIIAYGTSGSGSNLLFSLNTSLGLRWYFAGGTVDINQGSTSGWSSSTWYHIAAVRNGSTLTLYRNGISIASGTSTQVYGQNVTLEIGGSPGDSVFLNGYIDDFRITNGYARYTSNFTPPTSALPNYGM